MFVITKEYLYLYIINSQTQKINAMEKQIKVGKITLNVVMPYAKVVRYWKTDCNETHLKDQSIDELKKGVVAMIEERNSSAFWNQTLTFQYTHANTTRIMKALIEVLETGVQSKPITIQ